MQALTSWADVAFSSAERDRHLGIRPVSQLNTWPVVSPVNASRRPSRDAAHHSGWDGWLDLSDGGLSPPILCQLPWRTPLGVKTGCAARRLVPADRCKAVHSDNPSKPLCGVPAHVPMGLSHGRRPGTSPRRGEVPTSAESALARSQQLLYGHQRCRHLLAHEAKEIRLKLRRQP